MQTYKVYDKAIEKNHCNNIVKYLKELNFDSSTVVGDDGDILDEEKRQSQVAF